MISIYKAIKLNDVETIIHLIKLASSHAQQANKEHQSWLPLYLRGTNQKHYNLNRRSALGKTALHYAITWNRVEIVKLLIECPLVNINKRDLENGWSPLHRALYLGRLEIVCLLMKRDDLDLNIKDWEGYKALELFNTTLNHSESLLRKLETAAGPIMGIDDQTWTDNDHHYTTQSKYRLSKSNTLTHYGGTDLYTWGMNATYILGHLDSENRSRPERVPFYLESQQQISGNHINTLKRPNYVIESVHMSKFHLAILTSESRHNLLLCGFGRGGRLGTGKDTDAQLALSPMRWPERIIAVALGRDHTIAVTASGTVITFGYNDYGQLGYDTDAKEGGYSTQLHPRKIQAPNMKKQQIIGVAASKVHSVAFTSTELFTFGYNQGQLGYHYLGNERRQVNPRKVVYSSNSSNILQVVATDFATTILFENHDVVILANFETQKLIFPTNRFPSNIAIHSPANSYIAKLVSGGNIYTAAISNVGDVYIWTCKPSTLSADINMKQEQHRSKQAQVIISSPRRIWTGSRADMVATSVGIGQDGEVIISTASGQVYIGGVSKENTKDGKFKFQCVPQLQRCVSVCANPNGAYAAIRSEYQLPLPPQHQSTLTSDLLRSLPCMTMASPVEEKIEQLEEEKKRSLNSIECTKLDTDDPDAEKHRLEQQIEQQYKLRAQKIVDTTWKDMERQDDPTLDVCFWVQGKPIYSHLCILEGRRDKNKKSFLVDGDKNPHSNKSSGHIKLIITRQPSSSEYSTSATDKYNVIVEGCHLLSFFVLMDYIYGDTISYFSTRKIPALCTCFTQQPDLQEVRYDLIHLSALLGLSQLHKSTSSTYLPTPPSTLSTHMADLQALSNNGDVELVLKNGIITCHEVILRQRCPFFACLFDPKAMWMDGRRDHTSNQLAQVNLDHHSVETMACLVHYLYSDPQNEIDLCLPPTTHSTEEIMHFLLGLLSAADEFLLPALKVLCERALIPMINVRSVIMILECAHLYLAPNLKLACLTLIQANMSSFVIAGLLEHISLDLLQDLEAFVGRQQADAFPFVDRSSETTTVDNDDDIDLQMNLATWVTEEMPITRGYIERLETIIPAVTTPAPLLNCNTDHMVEPEATQQRQPERKKKNKKNTPIKKGMSLSTIHQQQQDQQQDLSSSSSTSDTGWGLSPESIETSKPSLRDLLEQEEAELAVAPSSTPKLTLGPSKKLSQKEKRKLQQQESLSAGPVDIPKPKTSVWGMIPTVNTSSILTTPETPSPVNSNKHESNPRSSTNGNGKENAAKGKKIFTSKESILEEQRQGWKRMDETSIKSDVQFNTQRTFGSTFELVPRIPLPTRKNSMVTVIGQNVRRGSSSFHAIQQEQKLEDDWIKNKRTKNLVRIQQEETAMEGLREFYIQTLRRGSGEWIDIHPAL